MGYYYYTSNSDAWLVYVIVFGVVLPVLFFVAIFAFAYRRRQAHLKRLAKLTEESNGSHPIIIYSNPDLQQQQFYYVPPGSPTTMVVNAQGEPMMYAAPTQPNPTLYRDPSPLPAYPPRSPGMTY